MQILFAVESSLLISHTHALSTTFLPYSYFLNFKSMTCHSPMCYLGGVGLRGHGQEVPDSPAPGMVAVALHEELVYGGRDGVGRHLEPRE